MKVEMAFTAEEKELLEPLRFEVLGAGEIGISKTNNYETGPIQEKTQKRLSGFGLGVSWSNGGIYIGGVLSDDEARKLAEHILNVLNGKHDGRKQ